MDRDAKYLLVSVAPIITSFEFILYFNFGAMTMDNADYYGDGDDCGCVLLFCVSSLSWSTDGGFEFLRHAEVAHDEGRWTHTFMF